MISNALGGYCFVPSIAILSVFVFYVMYRVPETRGKTLEQITAEMRLDD